VHGYGGGLLRALSARKAARREHPATLTLQENMCMVVRPTLSRRMKGRVQFGELVRVTKTGFRIAPPHAARLFKAGQAI